MYGYTQPNPPVYGAPAPAQPPQNPSQYPRMMPPQRDSYQQVGYMPQEQQIICRPVASYEEALGLPSDLNGALIIMPDFGHGMIYTKQLNFQTGQAPVNMFKHMPNAQPTAPQDYAPMLAEMERRLKHLEDMWEVTPGKSGQEENKS